MTIYLAIVDDDKGYNYKAFTTRGLAAHWLDCYAMNWAQRHSNPDMPSYLKGYSWEQIAERTGYQIWFDIEELTVQGQTT